MFQEKPGVYKYQNQINDIFSKGDNALLIFYEDLLTFDFQLADMLKNDPVSLLEDAIDAFKNILKFQSGKLNIQDYFVRITTKDDQSPLSIPLRRLRAKNIDKLIWSKGILIRSSTIRPKLMNATFECMVCGSQFQVLQLTSRIKWPQFCVNNRCKAKTQSDFRLISKNSEFIDWQSIVIQEIPEDLPAGRIPRSIQAILTYDLVDTVKPGDRIKIMGIFKSVLAQSTKSINSNIFRTFVDVTFIDPEDKSEGDMDLSKEEIKKIEEKSKEPFIQKKIARSIAPTIYGRDDLKMACALSLFSGTRRKKPGGNYKRGDIHILFVGDPGTGKSEILKSTIDVSPRGLYTSGKGASAVGLTAAVIKDTETGQMNLEAGAIVLANGGIAAIDEFDKMDTADRSALHEAMEQQSYHYNTEILTTNGERIVIGKFIDDFIATNKSKVIQGKNCEILPFNNLEIYSTNFNKIYKTKINRISRHEAPSCFYKLTFTNGRSINITPEHPIFVFNKGKLRCKNAEKCSINEFIPVPKYLPNSSKIIKLRKNENIQHILFKEVVFPEDLTPKLSRILGYFITNELSHEGSGPEFYYSNKDNIVIEEFNRLIFDLFNISPSKKERNDDLIRLNYISIELCNWMKTNFPEIMTISKSKRIPSKILGCDIENAREFLISAFKSDGYINSTSACIKAASKGLSNDYQDLLLKLGIHSYIVLDKRNDLYKVYIRGQSIIKFCDEIFEKNDRGNEEINNLINLNLKKTHRYEILPTSLIETIIKIKKDLDIPYNGYFNLQLKKNNGITRNVLSNELNIIKKKITLIENQINKILTISEIRKKIKYSQKKLAIISGFTRREIDFYERGYYNKNKRNVIKTILISSIKNKIEDIRKNIRSVDSIKDSDILWDRIISIKIIQNKGKSYTPWVYDLTVEPNHTFIGQGVVLHNTVSIAKAGIVATLKAQTAIIAAANPHSGRYDRYKTATQNIKLPPALLSRFDLIFVVVDRPDPSEDAQMAEFILQNSMKGTEDDSPMLDMKDEGMTPIPRDLLKKYIRYARRTCHPILTEEAKERIKEFYLKLRGQYDSEDAIISILARNLDALIRLSEAHAKMALRDKVTKEDVEDIIILFKRYLKDTGYDDSTGKIDMDRLFIGDSRSNLNKLEKFLTRIKEIFEENNFNALEKMNIVQILDLEEDFDKKYIEKALKDLITDGTLYEPKFGLIKFASKDD